MKMNKSAFGGEQRDQKIYANKSCKIVKTRNTAAELNKDKRKDRMKQTTDRQNDTQKNKDMQTDRSTNRQKNIGQTYSKGTKSHTHI